MEFQDLLLIVLGAAVGAIAAYFAMQAQISATRERLIRGYEAKLRQLQEHQNETIRRARKESVAQSRNVLRGKMAEQFAPLLPGFNYLPADARFLGDPIDYVVFDGYSALRDGKQEHPDDLEVVILDIKQGRSKLSDGQQAIARAIDAGRVRFEVVRVTEEGEVSTYAWQAEDAPPREAQGDNGAHEAENEQAQRERILAEYPRAYEKWYPEEDRWLVAQFHEGREMAELAALLKRRPSAIRARLEKLGVELEDRVSD